MILVPPITIPEEFINLSGGDPDVENVLLSPGNWFGTNTDCFIRVPLVQPVEVLKDVVERVKRFSECL